MTVVILPVSDLKEVAFPTMPQHVLDEFQSTGCVMHVEVIPDAFETCAVPVISQ